MSEYFEFVSSVKSYIISIAGDDALLRAQFILITDSLKVANLSKRQRKLDSGNKQIFSKGC